MVTLDAHDGMPNDILAYLGKHSRSTFTGARSTTLTSGFAYAMPNHAEVLGQHQHSILLGEFRGILGQSPEEEWPVNESDDPPHHLAADRQGHLAVMRNAAIQQWHWDALTIF